ncbi:hypothetical protein GUITHDRAFT_114560 [Guillardia theta CCMP2712]|uniref:LysM domain-containing protein n=1 Tax=Guillardia theta (strain CCMP2712) TaxID=905079 RepID=L1ITE8_GUITC|nr:hypothetical protein GUITHDRAFT_114560 [Guillardia theta CCMP2712]EKX39362.1 hypothetical protein GUITHDRAFT_114560 [Guillardia theta CCMP2712]|eukprot:XP_005826342.1 hypothetical protein GUITHDRAFT_114560 [Guillardia theta CCMP2712]
MLGVHGTITDPSGMLASRPVPGPQRVLMTGGRLTVVVGAMVEVNVYATVEIPLQDRNASILLLEEPGIPNGASLSEQRCLRQDGVCNPVTRRFRWEPRSDQVGTYRTCFLASLEEEAACERESGCFELVVEPPDISFLPVASGVATAMANVGCLYRACFRAKDVKDLYSVDISFSFSNLSFTEDGTCSSDLSDPSSSSLSPLFAASTGTAVFAPPPCERCVSWRPQQGQEGSVFELCSHAQDKSSTRSVSSCVKVEVEKCVVCLREGESLFLLARRSGMEAQWRHIWNANAARLFPVLSDPNVIVEEELAVRVGSSYRMKEQETVESLAMKFRTTVKTLMMFNPEMKETTRWVKDAIVCVIPCSGSFSAS